MKKYYHLPDRFPARWQLPVSWQYRGLCFLFLLTVALSVGCTSGSADASNGGASGNGNGGAKAAKTIEITVAPVTQRQVQRTVPATGTLSGYEDIAVTSKITGYVIKIHANTGDEVHPGDVLLEIDPTDYQLEYNEIYRAIEAEAARLGLTMPEQVLTLPELQEYLKLLTTLTIDDLPSVAQAIEVEKNARRQLDRGLALRQNRTITEQEIEVLDKDCNVARQGLDQARFNARAAISLVRQRYAQLSTSWQRLRDAKVVVPRSNLAIERLGENLTYHVARRNVREGEMVRGGVGMVGGGSAVFELVLDSVLKYHAVVPERFHGEVAIGQSVACRVESYPDEIFMGKIERISPQIDPVNRTFEAEVILDNSNRRLMAGGYARGSIIVRNDANALTVPASAVLTTVGTSKIFTLAERPADASTTTAVQMVIVRPGEEMIIVDPLTGTRENWVEVTLIDTTDTPENGVPMLSPDTLVAVTNLGALYQDAIVHLRTTTEEPPKEEPKRE